MQLGRRAFVTCQWALYRQRVRLYALTLSLSQKHPATSRVSGDSGPHVNDVTLTTDRTIVATAALV